jgi:hypothetical protein
MLADTAAVTVGSAYGKEGSPRGSFRSVSLQGPDSGYSAYGCPKNSTHLPSSIRRIILN